MRLPLAFARGSDRRCLRIDARLSMGEANSLIAIGVKLIGPGCLGPLAGLRRLKSV
jgi:hypothetical protein